MYKYTIQAMPGQKAKFEGDPSIRYRIKRQDTAAPEKQKGRSQIIRDNLEYEDAVAQIKSFNDVEWKSQLMREEAARQKKESES